MGLLPGEGAVWAQLKQQLPWLLFKPVLGSISAPGILVSFSYARSTLKAALAPVEEELIEPPPEQLLSVLQLLEQNG